MGMHSLTSIPLFRIGLAWSFLAVLLFSLPVQAEEDEAEALISAQKLELSQIQTRISELEAAVELDQTSKAALDLFRSALNRLKASQEDKEAVTRYRQTIDTAAINRNNILNITIASIIQLIELKKKT